jgi:regulator of protease activity HflC (stomatin/prohibitin superfamily)
MSWVWDAVEVIRFVLEIAVAFVIAYASAHPLQTALAILALLRQLGTTVQTGSKGVLFVWGHVRKELEPGFHPLVPLMMTVRKTPVRSITLELPHQRVTTADGLVYDVQPNIVYHVADPKRAVTEIDNLRHGIEAMLAVSAAELLRDLTRTEVLQVKTLEAELLVRVAKKVARWGVAVEQAGFTSIAPTKKTLHLTQLALRTAERERVLDKLSADGVPRTAAVALLGVERRLIGHATGRYRALHHSARLAPVIEAPPPAVPALPPPVQVQPQQQGQTGEAEPTLASLLAIETPTPTAPRPKKTTKGVQPRTWLRLQRRLKHLAAG